MIKARCIVFDCDGVLVDSEIIANRVEATVKTELGFPTTLEEQIRKFVGMGTNSEAVRAEFAKLPAAYPPLIDERIRDAFEKELQAIPGIEVLLASLPHPKCVASSSDPAWLRHKLALTKLDRHFPNAVFSGHEVEFGKPAPDLFLHAAKTMGWMPEECLVVEDSVPGVLAGRAAGMKVCGFLGGSHIFDGHAEDLLEAGAHHVVSRIGDIRAFLT